MIKLYLFKRSFLFALLLCSLQSWAQTSVTGKVTSGDDGDGLPGVSILEKGTTNGTVTNIDGNYSINVGEDATLVFSFVGFTTQEIAVGTQSAINLILQPDVTALSEVVIVGYGEQEKKDVTGVVTAVTSEDFNRGAIVSPDQLIAGKISGVQITSNSGEPGGGSTIRIRGGTSLSAGNEPLYVIDGIPIDNVGFPGGRNPLNFINPSDIESFTVLKDASAAAIYGSRAANGVIIITTKKGTAGQAPRVTYDGYYNISEVAKKLDVFNADQYRELTSAYSPANIINDLHPTASTDWQDQILQTATGQSHNISVTGGSEKTGYRASIGYLNLDGIVKTSNTERTSFALSLNQKMLDDNLTIDANIKTSQTRDRYNGGGIGGANNMAPTQPVYDAGSPYGGFWEWVAPLGTKNPVAEVELTQHNGKAYRGMGNIQFDYKFTDLIPGLRANLNLGADVINAQRKFYQPTFLRAQTIGNQGEIQLENITRVNQLLEFYLNYTRDLESIEGKIDVTAGYSWQDFDGDQFGSNGRELTSNDYGYEDPSVAGVSSAWANPNANRIISFFGRVNFALKDKYLFTANLRRDGSSRFGEVNKWGLFPSAAIGWRIYEEDFFAGLQDVFSDLKLRVSYGVNGNQEFGNYQYLSTYGLSNQFAQYQLGETYYRTLRPSGVDPTIKWEETTSINLGLDFGLFQGKVTGAVEFYNKQTDDLLFVVNIPAGTNVTNRVLTNIGSVRNQGVELTLNTIVVDKQDLRWDVGFNISSNRNEITALDGSDDPNFKGYEAGPISGGVGNNIQVLRVGQPVNTFRVYQHKYDADGNPYVDGIDQNEDGVINEADMYEDLSGDGQVNDEDRRPGENANPVALLGLTSNLSFKNFNLNFTLRGSLGNYAYNNVASSNAFLSKITGFTISPENMPVSVLQTNFTDPQFFSDYYVEDASFLRMDNITLGYSFPQLNKVSVRLYATAQNLFVLTNYSGIDPEVLEGRDNNAYPRSRNFVFGVNIGL